MVVQVSVLEARIIRILKDWYPITVEELRDELALRRDTLDRTLKALVVKGIVVLEPLNDKTYIRLLTPDIDIDVPGKKVKKKISSKPDDHDSIMYR